MKPLPGDDELVQALRAELPAARTAGVAMIRQALIQKAATIERCIARAREERAAARLRRGPSRTRTPP